MKFVILICKSVHVSVSVSEFENTKSLIKKTIKKYMLFVLSKNSGKYSLQKYE